MKKVNVEETQRRLDALRTETYQKRGALYWRSSDNPVLYDFFQDPRNGVCLQVPTEQKAEIERYASEFFATYAKAQANRKPSAEELFEMRAAFGPDAEVVNVITGRRTRT